MTIICYPYILFILLSFYSTCSYATCVIAIKCIDGIALGSDTLAVNGNLIGNRETIKIKQLSNNIMICCASGLKSSQELFSELESEIRLKRLMYNTELSMTSIANYIRHKLHASDANIDKAHFIIAGISTAGGAKDAKIYEILPGGSLMEQDYVVAGPSSGNLYPLLLELCSKYKDSKLTSSAYAFESINKLLITAKSYDQKSGGHFKRYLLRFKGNRLDFIKDSIHLKKLLLN